MAAQAVYKAPYLALLADGEPLGGRIVAAELRGALETPRAVGYVDFDDPAGEVAAAAPKGTAVQLLGGRRGGGQTVVLTGTVYAEPVREPANRLVVRVYVADRWAISDAVKVTAHLKAQTAQEIISHLLDTAGIAERRLSPATLQPERLSVMLEECNLAKAVKEVERMWSLDNGDLEFNQKFGLKPGPVRHWWVGFAGDGTFFWENWPDSPQAQAEPLRLEADDLIRLEREPTKDGEKGRMELFFEPRLAPGVRVEVLGTRGRVEERLHRFDGGRFRTQVTYGPIPG